MPRYLALLAFIALAAFDSFASARVLPLIIHHDQGPGRSGATVTLKSSDPKKSEFILVYTPTGRKDPAQTGEVSTIISKDVADVLFEILEKSKPAILTLASDSRCIEGPFWTLQSGETLRKYCRNKSVDQTLARFISSASEILRPD